VQLELLVLALEFLDFLLPAFSKVLRLVLLPDLHDQVALDLNAHVLTDVVHAFSALIQLLRLLGLLLFTNDFLEQKLTLAPSLLGLLVDFEVLHTLDFVFVEQPDFLVDLVLIGVQLREFQLLRLSALQEA